MASTKKKLTVAGIVLLAAVAYLAAVGALRPHADGRYAADEAPTWERLAPVLLRIGESYEAFGLRDAVVGSAGTSGALRLASGKGGFLVRCHYSPEHDRDRFLADHRPGGRA